MSSKLDTLKREITDTLDWLDNEHKRFNDEFFKNQKESFNLRSVKINKIQYDKKFQKLLRSYIKNLSKIKVQTYPGKAKLGYNNFKGKLDMRYRVKGFDSVQKKIAHYCKDKNGHFVISKSINDLFGARIVLSNVNMYKEDIINYLNMLKVNRKKDIIRVLDRRVPKNQPVYFAIHVYIQKENNYFPWELQIWDLDNNESNLSAHKDHEKEKSGGRL